jgi:hypothetical protein
MKIDPLHKFFVGFYLVLLAIVLFVLAMVNSNCEQPIKYKTEIIRDTVYVDVVDTLTISTSGLEQVALARWMYDEDGNFGVYAFCGIRNTKDEAIYHPNFFVAYYKDLEWDTLVWNGFEPFFLNIDFTNEALKLTPGEKAYSKIWAYLPPQTLYWSFWIEWE